MGVLWYAIGIYMIGVAIVLYIRPRIMFHENGMWKEFGLATEADQTIFPFWMFALLWAIISYAVGNLISIFFASIVLKSNDVNVSGNFIKPISEYPNAAMPKMPQASIMPQMSQAPTFVQTSTPQMTQTPGYYILDPYASPTQPRYIYYGTEPPRVTNAL